ncbi:CCR4-NOT core DEDD RNase subunit [Teratosphaeriaceae sp. CCFEE 6253]|nr:CCR4-NOT core DEDD RNase subunit [Teratosphaeriaceae sp. CCFEE 6253]
MPPATGRMHPSHMSNPFQQLNQHHAIPPSAHYSSQSQSNHIPHTFGSQPSFGSNALNGGISPFNPSSAYGGSAFTTGAASGAFNGSMLGAHGQGLASVAAQQGFARGAAMQEHTHQAEAASLGLKSGAPGRIREVWSHNLEQEFAILRQLILKYPYVSMDAEFPGIVARPIGNFLGSKAEYHYQTLRCNVDILKPIQVGITLWTPEGELPPHQPDPQLSSHINSHKSPYHPNVIYLPTTWVFNFHFDLNDDMYAESSIQMLKDTGGVNFDSHQTHGLSHEAFGSLLTTSGLAFNEDVNWLSFHSGYDFGYLIKLLTNDALPQEQADFFDLVRTFFPRLWDIKFLLRHAQRLKTQGRLGVEATRIVESLGPRSGLQDLADELGCTRVGPAHTGGSDAWLTGSVFWSMRTKIFNGILDLEQADQIYGLHGVAAPASQQFRDDFLAAARGTPHQQPNGLGAPAGTSSLQGGAQGYTPNHPSTPTSTHAGLSGQTPGPGQGGHYGHAMGGGSLGQGGFSGFGGYGVGAGK